jgi:hypothetical protein
MSSYGRFEVTLTSPAAEALRQQLLALLGGSRPDVSWGDPYMDYGPSRYGSLLMTGDVLVLEGILAPKQLDGGGISFTVPRREPRTFTLPPGACLLVSQTTVQVDR